jgi:hypothetical protein
MSIGFQYSLFLLAPSSILPGEGTKFMAAGGVAGIFLTGMAAT